MEELSLSLQAFPALPQLSGRCPGTGMFPAVSRTSTRPCSSCARLLVLPAVPSTPIPVLWDERGPRSSRGLWAHPHHCECQGELSPRPCPAPRHDPTGFPSFTAGILPRPRGFWLPGATDTSRQPRLPALGTGMPQGLVLSPT